MRVDVLTLFPDIFAGYLKQPVVESALEHGLVKVHLHNFGDRALSRDDVVSRDIGHGIMLNARPIVECLNRIRTCEEDGGHLIMLTPRGRRFDQRVAEELSRQKRLILLCGRFAGFDPRLRTELQPDEVSVGEFVLNGGEVAALVIIDTVLRLLPGVLGEK